jgi:hypothetical protein
MSSRRTGRPIASSKARAWSARVIAAGRVTTYPPPPEPVGAERSIAREEVDDRIMAALTGGTASGKLVR